MNLHEYKQQADVNRAAARSNVAGRVNLRVRVNTLSAEKHRLEEEVRTLRRENFNLKVDQWQSQSIPPLCESLETAINRQYELSTVTYVNLVCVTYGRLSIHFVHYMYYTHVSAQLGYKPAWLANVKKLNVCLNKFLALWSKNQPLVTQCASWMVDRTYKSRQALHLHVNNIKHIMKWKCAQNEQMYTQLQNALFDECKSDIANYYAQKFQFTCMNCNVLQDILRAPDKRWRDFVHKVNGALGWRLFQSEYYIQMLRNHIRPQTLNIFTLELETSTVNRYNVKPMKKYCVASITETEIISAAFDAQVNNNDWIWQVSKFDYDIWGQIGGDKATKGGYSESICLAGTKFSVHNSMASLYIPGKVYPVCVHKLTTLAF